jgi:hypothetical protein
VDLLAVRRRVTANGIGTSRLDTPDGRHAEYARAVAAAIAALDKYGQEPQTAGPLEGTTEWQSCSRRP